MSNPLIWKKDRGKTSISVVVFHDRRPVGQALSTPALRGRDGQRYLKPGPALRFKRGLRWEIH